MHASPFPICSPRSVAATRSHRNEPNQHPHRGGALGRRGGFALLITIVLVAFLVLLLVGLATFTRVETQVATNAQQQAQARQNALMALNIAVGQLQKYAGPDQRTTARADLENPTAPNSRWSGAYGSSIAVATNYSATSTTLAASLSDATKVNGNGSSARLLNWLVSGNEPAPFDPVRGSANVGSAGEIAAAPAAASIPFKPTTAVANLFATTSATALDLTISDGTANRPARLLVGPNTVTSALSGTTPIDYVAAPAVDISVPASSVPGAGSAGNITVGRYAWWVGDEGVKARVNLPIASASLAEKRNALASSSRAAIELMGRDHNAALNATSIGSIYQTGQDLKKIVALPQAPMAMASGDSATFSAALKHRFHDVTPHSFSVLSDTYAGGLKKDLTALLDTGYTASVGETTFDTDPIYPPADPASGSVSTFAMPTWGHLRSFARAVVPTSGPDANKLSPQLPVLDRAGETPQMGIAPIMTYMAVGIRYTRSGNTVRLRTYPVVVLWNPYTSIIKAGQYEAGFCATYNTRVRVQIEDPAQASGWRVIESRDFKYGAKVVPETFPTDRDLEYMRYVIETEDIPAGESRVFTLRDASAAYVAGANLLKEGLNDEHYAYMDGATIAVTEAGNNLRVVTRYATGASSYSTSASSFSNGGGGENYAYLGRANPASSPIDWNPTDAPNRWYQMIQRVGSDGNNVRTVTRAYPGSGSNVTESVIQDGTNFENGASGDHPAFSMSVMAVFSASGTNGTANQGTLFRQRWIAQSNLRAPYAYRTSRDNNYCVPYISQVGSIGRGLNRWPLFFNTDAPGDRASAGVGHDWRDLGGGSLEPVDATLFDIRKEDQPILSIGQLQQANLSPIDAYPSYPVGNSLADFRLNADALSSNVVVQTREMTGLQKVYYDNSWLLNHALWDRFFFSTVSPSGALPTLASDLPNPRHRILTSSADLRDPNLAAANLLLAGGFNINSTSEHAWRAILGGTNQLGYDPQTGNNGAPLAVAFSRFLNPTSADNTEQPWEGYRQLNANQIAQLSRNIVAEIRARGPFISLADFVNRRLVNNATTAEDERLKGALQAAIDATTANAGGAYPTNDASNPASFWATDPKITNADLVSQPYVLNHMRGSAVASQSPFSGRSAFAPKFLTQGDILSTIGAGLSARSDTFTIRTYGEVLNPATNDIEGRAWCEATVQRVPEYIDGSVNASATPSNGSVSETFGRKIKIISFRWLSPSDI